LIITAGEHQFSAWAVPAAQAGHRDATTQQRRGNDLLQHVTGIHGPVPFAFPLCERSSTVSHAAGKILASA
jgi:hypothetical protein